jgi:hypothetical protein
VLRKSTFALVLVTAGCSGGMTLGTRLSSRFEGVSDFESVHLDTEKTSAGTISIVLDKSASEKIKRLVVRRYEGAECEGKSESEGTLISENPSQSTWEDRTQSPSQTYCYKAFIYDVRGRLVTKTAVQAASEEPVAGNIEYSDFGEKKIGLKHTVPKFEGYNGVELRRYDGDQCANAAAVAGKLLPLDKEATLYTDSELDLGHAYCYKIFWYNNLGSVTSATLAFPLFEVGALAIKSLGTQRIDLTMTPAQKDDFVSFELRRFASLTCESSDASQGTLLSTDKALTEHSDKGLELDTPYCYRATWRDLIGNQSQKTVVYAGKAPRAGSIAIAGMASRSLSLLHTNSVDPQVAQVILRRYTQTQCSGKKMDEGIGVNIRTMDTTIDDTSLELGTPYCYKAFWLDAFGNFSETTVPTSYPGGPTGGALSVHSLSDVPSSITLAHVPPSSQNYENVDLRRYVGTACATETPGTGVSLTPFAKIAANYIDTTLSLATAYCYKAFWYDTFGNSTSASVVPPVLVGSANVSITALEPQKVILGLTTSFPRTNIDFQLVRFNALSCATTDPSTGTRISTDQTITSFEDGGLALGQDYCYRAIWSDPIGNKVEASTAYSSAGPVAGSISISSIGPLALTLAHTPSADSSLDHVVLRRYAEAPCTSKGPADGTDVPLSVSTTQLTDTSGLALGTSYCYGAFWYDRFGNYSKGFSSQPYYGSGPAVGTIAIASYGSQSISLSHTPSVGPHYDHVILRRYVQASCSTGTVTGGEGVSLSPAQSAVTDGALPLGTSYCYKAFWYDSFGNVAEAPVATPYVMQLPQGGDLQIASLSNQTIQLAITVPPAADPANSGYDNVVLRRLAQSSCTGASVTSGTGITLGKQATTYTDSGLSLDTPYCYKIFWRDVFGNSSSDQVFYAGVGPDAGHIALSDLSSQSIHLAVTPSTDTNVTQFALERYAMTSCSTAARGTGTPLAVTTTTTGIIDSSLALNQAYCYRAFWLDDFGNFKSASVAYSGAGPQGGSIRVTGRSADTIAIGHTVPTTGYYSGYDLRRYPGSTCSNELISSGTSASAGTTLTNILDAGLSAETNYCYKIFWTDKFGNASSGLIADGGIPSRTTGKLSPSCMSDSSSQQTTFIAGTYNQHPTISQSLTVEPSCTAPGSWVDAGISEVKPAFLTTNWTSGRNISFTGTFAPDASHQLSATPLTYNWSINIDGTKNAAMPLLRVLDGADTSYSNPQVGTLNDNAALQLPGSATLNSLYNGSSVALAYLTGSAAHDVSATLGPVTFGTDTDIPGLTYVASGAGSGPYMTSGASSYTAASHTVSGSYSLLWDYSSLDQGEYFVRTKPFLNIDGGYVYGSAAPVGLTLNNVGSESTLASGTDMGNYAYAGTDWDAYLPAMSLALKTSGTSVEEVSGVLYHAKNTARSQYFGSLAIQRPSSGAPSFAAQFSTDAERGSGQTMISTTGNNAAYMTIATVPASSSWVTLSNEDNDFNKQLVLTYWPINEAHPRFELKDPSELGFNALFGAVAMTEAYEQTGTGTSRHGVAFYAKNNADSSSGIYLTSVRSEPVPKANDSESYDAKLSRYFDLVPYPAAGSNTISHHIPSVTVASAVAETATMVRLDKLSEAIGGQDQMYFYAGWRTGSSEGGDGFHSVQVARVSADLGSAPTAMISSTPLSIPVSTVKGQGFYTLAAGQDVNNSPLVLLAYAPFSATGDGVRQCGIRAYHVSGGGLVPVGATGTILATPAGTASCVFPHIFYQKSRGVFHLLWTGATTIGASPVTYYERFKVTDGGASLMISRETTAPVVVTDIAGLDRLCGFSAGFADVSPGIDDPRLALLRVERLACSSGASTAATMRFDTYKPPR